MKTSIKQILFLALFSIVLVGCDSKEEEPAVKENVIILDGKEFAVSQAYTDEYGGNAATGYNFDLIIGSSGFNFSDPRNDISGTGNILYFELWSTSSTGLAAGTYTNSISDQPNTYTSTFIGINYSSATNTADESYEDNATGTVKITVNGSTYKVDFDLTLDGTKKLTGNYTGVVPNY